MGYREWISLITKGKTRNYYGVPLSLKLMKLTWLSLRLQHKSQLATGVEQSFGSLKLDKWRRTVQYVSYPLRALQE